MTAEGATGERKADTVEKGVRTFWNDEAGGMLRPVLLSLLLLVILGVIIVTSEGLMAILEPLKRVSWLFRLG